MSADGPAPLCERKSTRPEYMPLALMRALADGNKVEYYQGRPFQVFLRVADEEHDVWAWSAPEYEAETHQARSPASRADRRRAPEPMSLTVVRGHHITIDRNSRSST